MLRVLAVAILLTMLLANRVLRGRRVLAVAVLPALVGAILAVMVWLSLGPSGTQTSVNGNDVVWACGRKVLPEYRELAEYRDIARGMRKDCGIFGSTGGRD